MRTNSSLNILVCLADLVSEAAPWSVHSCGDINPEGVNLHLSSGPALPVSPRGVEQELLGD